MALLTYDSSLHTSASLATIDFQALDASGGATSPVVHRATVRWDGAGNIYLFIDNAYVGTVATAPTGMSSNGANIVFEANNGGDTTSDEGWWYEIRGSISN